MQRQHDSHPMERPEKTTRRVHGTTQEVNASARVLRRAETPAERVLWQALRGRRLDGLKFRRQHAIGRFVLDFYCPDHRLVVELDGTVHDCHEEQDAYRTDFLAAYGYRVLRFRNEEVLSNLPTVLDRIVQAAKHAAASTAPTTDGLTQ